MIKSSFFALCVLIAVFVCGCAKDKPEEKIKLIIKTPMQELNALANPNIRDVTTFLTQAANDFSGLNPDQKITPEVKTFNYVDEIKAVPQTFGTPLAPDVLFGAFFNLASYIDTGLVVPLDDLLQGELIEDLDPLGLKLATRNGKIYIMPFLSMQNILIYNKRLFEECGLSRFMGKPRQIQNWSLEEWQTILDTLAARLPEGKYPLAIFAKNNQGDTHIMTYLRAFGGSIFDSEGNFDFQNPKIVKALAWLQEGVRRKWFPPHAENLEMKDCSELFANGQLAIYMFNNANRALYSHLDDYGFVNYPGNLATVFYNGFIIFDNGDPRKLEAAKKFLLHIFRNDEWRDLSAGNMPASRKTLNRFRDKIAMVDQFSQNSVNVVDFLRQTPNWQGRADSVRSVFWPNIHKLLELKISPEQCAADLDKVCNAAIAIGKQSARLHP